MGNASSGWFRATTPLVEDALALDIRELARDGIVRSGERRSATVSWSHRDRPPHAAISVVVDLRGALAPHAVLLFAVDNRSMTEVVLLECTRPHLGGQRWWWICPVTFRRAAVLHLPPGTTTFAHRSAYGLAYRSARHNGAYRSAIRALARQTGRPPEAVREALRAMYRGTGRP